MGRTKRSLKTASKAGRARKKLKRKTHAKRAGLAARHHSRSMRRRSERRVGKSKKKRK